jgi:hypothetical protein
VTLDEEIELLKRREEDACRIVRAWIDTGKRGPGRIHPDAYPCALGYAAQWAIEARRACALGYAAQWAIEARRAGTPTGRGVVTSEAPAVLVNARECLECERPAVGPETVRVE